MEKKVNQRFPCFFHGIRKRGVSAVVATILIILIAVAGVGIVWQVILPFFQELNY